MDGFKINVAQTGSVSVVSLLGQADMMVIEKLDEAFDRILDGAAGHIVVDMGGLDFICSVGLSSLIRAYRKCNSAGYIFALCSVPVMIQHLLSTTQLDSFFVLYADQEKACCQLNSK